MQCDICARHHGQQLPFQCPTCARSALYGLRVQLGQALLDNNSFVRQINPMIAAATRATSPSSPATRGSKSRLAIEEASARAERAAERTKDISNHIEILRKEIEDSKADIAKRKAALAQRRSDASSATHNLKARRAATLETVEKGTKKLEYRWNSLHAKTVEARVFLCREAANLYHLRQRRRKKGGSVREDYTIGGVGIVDLRDLNSMSPLGVFSTCIQPILIPFRCITRPNNRLPNLPNLPPPPNIALPPPPAPRRNPPPAKGLPPPNNLLPHLILPHQRPPLPAHQPPLLLAHQPIYISHNQPTQSTAPTPTLHRQTATSPRERRSRNLRTLHRRRHTLSLGYSLVMPYSRPQRRF